MWWLCYIYLIVLLSSELCDCPYGSGCLMSKPQWVSHAWIRRKQNKIFIVVWRFFSPMYSKIFMFLDGPENVLYVAKSCCAFLNNFGPLSNTCFFLETEGYKIKKCAGPVALTGFPVHLPVVDTIGNIGWNIFQHWIFADSECDHC